MKSGAHASEWQAYLLLTITAFLWGGNMTAGKLAEAGVSMSSDCCTRARTYSSQWAMRSDGRSTHPRPAGGA